MMTAAAFAVMALPIGAQGPRTPPMGQPVLIGPGDVHGVPHPMPKTDGHTSEKAIAVNANVNMSICVTQGSLKINGWNRNEVRVFVKEGSKFGFKVLEKSKQNDPVWIMLTSVETSKSNPATECIWGDEIEMDVPVNATINIKGRETKTAIDTVRKVNVKSAGGDVNVRNVSEGVIAAIYVGDVTVEGSKGGISLETTTGNILVFEAGPSEIGDTFKAKTSSGMISLQKVAHRQIEVGSISGSIAFNGDILNGGSYSLSTSNGSIRMSLPAATSCMVTAWYGFGSFDTDMPIKILTENIEEGPVKRITGLIGKGDATLKLTTNNGSIAIVKQ